MAESFLVALSPHNYNSTLVALASTVHASATMPNFIITEYFLPFVDFCDKISPNQLKPKNGYIELPTAPGLGVDVMQFAPVARMAEDTFLLWVHADTGITTFEQWLEEARTRGNNWVMGGTGSNSEDNIITDFLNTNYGLSMKYIPYKGGGAVAKDVAGKQIDSSVNNPSEAIGFWQSGDMVPLVAFTDKRLPMFPDVPTLGEIFVGGKQAPWAYYMQRAVVGAPGQSAEATAYYTDLFTKVYNSKKWQDYKSKKSLMGDFMAGDELKAYWTRQVDNHRAILKASGAIK